MSGLTWTKRTPVFCRLKHSGLDERRLRAFVPGHEDLDGRDVVGQAYFLPTVASRHSDRFRARGRDTPDWLAELGGYRPCQDELPPGFGSGWRYAAPLIHMPTYLGYLQARLGRADGRIRVATVASLAGAGHEAGARVVVNCSGAHARQLAGDPAVTPVRGQTVVTANPGLTEFVVAPGSESAGSPTCSRTAGRSSSAAARRPGTGTSSRSRRWPTRSCVTAPRSSRG